MTTTVASGPQSHDWHHHCHCHHHCGCGHSMPYQPFRRCFHDWPATWDATAPPSCGLCGEMAPAYDFTYTNTPSSST